MQSSSNNKHKLPAAKPPPKQVSILNFLSRGRQRAAVNPKPPLLPLLRSNTAPSTTHLPTRSAAALGASPPRSSAALDPAEGTLLPVPPSIALTPSASLAPVTESHLPALRTLNQVTLPVQYSDKFYAAVLSRAPRDTGLYSRVILFHPPPSAALPLPGPLVAGAVVCRAEVSPFRSTRSPDELVLYIQSLALFSPYRGKGLMGMAIKEILRYAANNPPEPGKRIGDAYVHVWTENRDALDWYAKQGFEKVGEKPLEGYYHRFSPGTAWVLRRRLKVGDLLAHGTRSGRNATAAADASTIPKPRVETLSTTTTTTGLGLTVAPHGRGPCNAAKQSPNPSPSPSPGPGLGGQNFQTVRPNMEWNDLPAEMIVGAGNGDSGVGNDTTIVAAGTASIRNGGSAASSRSSSAVRKKTRGYPDVAFRT